MIEKCINIELQYDYNNKKASVRKQFCFSPLIGYNFVKQTGTSTYHNCIADVDVVISVIFHRCSSESQQFTNVGFDGVTWNGCETCNQDDKQHSI